MDIKIYPVPSKATVAAAINPLIVPDFILLFPLFLLVFLSVQNIFSFLWTNVRVIIYVIDIVQDPADFAAVAFVEKRYQDNRYHNKDRNT